MGTSKKDAKDFEALKKIGLELEAPQDEYSYQPGSGSIANGAVAAQENGVDVELDAVSIGEDRVGRRRVEDPDLPIPGESSWSQNHRLPIEEGDEVERMSDEDLLELVEERLDHHPQLGGLRIEAIVSHGAVALRGRVPSEAARMQAGELIEALPGVIDIRNSLEVERD